MAGTSTRLFLPYPSGSDPNNTPSYMQSLAQDIDDKLAQEGTTAARNALTARQGMRHWTTDGGGASIPTSSFRTSSAWVNESRYSADTRDNRPAANSVLPGHMFWATDQIVLYMSDGTTWHRIGTACGTLQAFPGASGSVPAGHVMPYGQLVSRTGIYQDLFAIYGTTYGAGDGSTTFQMPDFRGLVPVFLDNMGGVDAGKLTMANTLGLVGGAEKHTLITAELPSHTHTMGSHTHTTQPHTHAVIDPSHRHAIGVPANLAATGGERQEPGSNGNANSGFATTGISLQQTTVTVDSASGSGGATGSGNSHNNMQPHMLVNGIVKL